MARYLVTGGAGFIGSHLTAALLRGGHDVRVLDDLSTGAREHLWPGVSFSPGDVADPATVQAAMAGCDGCFHLAAIASVPRCTEDWTGATRVNLGGTVAVLDAAARAGGVPVVQASSSAIYGDARAQPIREDTALPAPMTAYGADKLGGEQHGRVAALVHGVPNAALRFFNVYGPRQDPTSPYSGVIAIFADRIPAGKPVTIFGDGGQTRDFVFVTDVVDALDAAMRRVSGGETAQHLVCNVASGRSVSLWDLAGAIGTVTGATPEVTLGPARKGDIRASCGDPSRMASLLGVRARVGLVEGLSRLIAEEAPADRAIA